MLYIIFKSIDGEGKTRFTPIIFPEYIHPQAIVDMVKTQDADGTTSFTPDTSGELVIEECECRRTDAMAYVTAKPVLDRCVMMAMGAA